MDRMDGDYGTIVGDKGKFPNKIHIVEGWG